MNHVTVLGARSILLASFAMIHAFVDYARADNSLYSWGVVTLGLAALFAVSVRVTPGPHQTATVVMAVASGLVGVVAIGAAILATPQLLVWTIVAFGVVVGASEIVASRQGENIPANDHLLLGGASLMLALASLIEPLDATWLSGVMVGWAAIGAVLAGTASVQWKDQISPSGPKENES